MKTHKTASLKLFVTAALVAGFVGTSASAGIITPTGATLAAPAAAIDGNRTVDKTIDGSGLSGVGDILTQTHNIASGSEYFLSGTGASNITDVQYDFDLNGASNVGSFTVDGVHLWNYAAGNNTQGRGLGTTDIYFSTDNGSTYSLVPVTVNFTAAANNTPVVVQTHSFAAVAGVTDIRLIADNLTGATTNRSAFMEIRFNEVPEPGSLALLGLGGLLIGARRRR